MVVTILVSTAIQKFGVLSSLKNSLLFVNIAAAEEEEEEQ